MTLEAAGTLKAGATIRYLFMMVRGEVLCQFYVLSVEVESSILETLMYIILGFGIYFLLLMRCSRKSA